MVWSLIIPCYKVGASCPGALPPLMHCYYFIVPLKKIQSTMNHKYDVIPTRAICIGNEQAFWINFRTYPGI